MAEQCANGRTPTLPQTRKRSVVTLEKMEMELHNGHSQRTVAENYGVVKSTVGDIWKYLEIPPKDQGLHFVKRIPAVR